MKQLSRLFKQRLEEMGKFLLLELLRELDAVPEGEGLLQLCDGEESAFVHLVEVGLRVDIGGEGKGGDEFAFAAGLPDVLEEETALCLPDMEPEFLAGLAEDGLLERFSIIDVSAHRGVPAAGGDVFPHGALLEIEAAFTIEYMEMDDGMERHGSAMAIAARGLTNDVSGFVDEGEQFLLLAVGIVESYHNRIDFWGRTPTILNHQNEKMRPQVGLGAASFTIFSFTIYNLQFTINHKL